MEAENVDQKYLSLIRARAYSFYRTTGVPMNELVAEGGVVYAECMLKYVPNNLSGASFTTFFFTALTNHFSSYCKQYERHYRQEILFSDLEREAGKYNASSHHDWLEENSGDLDTLLNSICPSGDRFDKRLEFYQSIKKLSPKSQGIIELLDSCANEILAMCPKKTEFPHAQRNLIGSLRRYLMKLGWKRSTIDNCFRELTLFTRTI